MKKTVLTVSAICMATLLLCCAACFGTVSYLQRQAPAAAETPSAALRTAETPLTGGYSTAALTQRTGRQTLSATEIYDLACQQVVGISTTFTGYNMFGQLSSNAVSGTGFIISEDGYILTNNHVVEDALSSGSTVTVKLYDGSEYDAEIVGVEGTNNDIAVLKINASGLTPVTLGNSDDMRVGESVYVVGNPLGELTYTMTSGIISALDREIAADRNTSVNMFQLDAAVNSGNSGGPVYNAYGQVIGVVTAKYRDDGVEGLGFAIPIDDAASIANDLITKGYVTGKAYMGVGLDNRWNSMYALYYNMPLGAYVYFVESGSAAEEAGIRPGDIITALGDSKVESYTGLKQLIRQYSAGDSAQVTVYRAGEFLTLDITFQEARPGSDSDNPANRKPTAGDWT